MTMQASPAPGPEVMDVADRRTGKAWNRDTSAVIFWCIQMGGHGDARARETLARARETLALVVGP